MLEFLAADDATPAEDLPITNFESGAESDTVELHLWNDRGDPLGQRLDNVLLVQQVEDPSQANVFLSSGVPPQDELWGRLRIVGFNNNPEPSWTPTSTDWQPVGAFAPFLLGPIPADCAFHLEWRAVAPSSAGPNSWRFKLSTIEQESSRPAPPLLTQLQRGILTHAGDPAHSALLSGCDLLPSDPADGEIHLQPGIYQFQGKPYGQAGCPHALDQMDGADPPQALAAGESYWAALSLGPAGTTVTKGMKGAMPAKPALPVGEVLVRYVSVTHQPLGTSEILGTDFDGSALYDRHLLTVGAGLDVTVHQGQAIGGGTWRYWTRPQELQAPDDATSTLWQTETGAFAWAPNETPPTPTSLGPLWEVEAAAGAVVAVRDRRPYAGRTRLLRFAGPTPAAIGDLVDEFLVEDAELHWEATAFRVSDKAQDSGATAGATKMEILIGGATAFPSQAVTDLRPQVAFDAEVLLHRAAVNELAVLRRGGNRRAPVLGGPPGGARPNPRQARKFVGPSRGGWRSASGRAPRTKKTIRISWRTTTAAIMRLVCRCSRPGFSRQP